MKKTRLLTPVLASIAFANLALCDLEDELASSSDPLSAPPPAQPRLWWGDVDGDGLVDAYVTRADGSARLLQNAGDGLFEDVTERAGLSELAGAHMAVFGDVNDDERLDLYLPAWRGPSRLLVQTEDETFVDQTDAAGLPRHAEPLDARFLDVDGDGSLDLWLTTLHDDLVYANDGRGAFQKLDLGIVARAVGDVPRPQSLDAARALRGLDPLGSARAGGGAGASGPGGPNNPTFEVACAIGIQDQSNPADCLSASTVPTMGMLYPLSGDFYVDAATGRVGIGLTNPASTLHVNGHGRFQGTIIAAGSNPPIFSSSTNLNPNLNADLLDGLDASAFAQLPITTGDIQDATITQDDLADGSVRTQEIFDGAILNQDVHAAAAIAGTKIDPDFGSQTVVTLNDVLVGHTTSILATADVSIVEPPSNDQAWLSLFDEEIGAPGTYVETFIAAREDAGFAGGQIGTRSAHPLRLFAASATFMEAATTGDVRMFDSLDVDGAMNVDGVLTSNASNVLTIQENVVGTGTATFGDGGSSNWEVKGRGFDANGYLGVQGKTDFDGFPNLDVTADEIGVLGVSTGTSSDDDNTGVMGHSNHIGVWGLVYGSGAAGVRGENMDLGGTTFGVFGRADSPNGWGIYAQGRLAATGSKSFIQPHPGDPSKEIRFVCLEGNESGTYFRGTGRVVDGQAVIDVPEEFRLVSEPDGLTVQLTPVGGLAVLAVQSQGLERIHVLADADVEFHYMVNGVRRGFAKYEPIGENVGYVPEVRGEPAFGYLPEDARRILVENGVLNSDYTPNEATAAALGWTLRDPRSAPASGFDEAADQVAPIPEPPSTVIPLADRPRATFER